MTLHKLLAALTLVGVAATLAGLGTFATPVAISVSNANAAADTHYVASGIRYTTDPALPLDITTLTFDVHPAIVGTSDTTVSVRIQLTQGALTSIAYQCSFGKSGSTVTCATTSPQLTVDRLKGASLAS